MNNNESFESKGLFAKQRLEISSGFYGKEIEKLHKEISDLKMQIGELKRELEEEKKVVDFYADESQYYGSESQSSVIYSIPKDENEFSSCGGELARERISKRGVV